MSASNVPIANSAPSTDSFRDDVLAGLRQSPKRLSCKYFYDSRGSALFERICELDEYYLTRTELEIMETHAADMAASLGLECLLIEYGSGSSRKTRLLLDHLIDPAAYVPIDIAHDHLSQSSIRIADEHPGLKVIPVCADFTDPDSITLPDCGERSRVIYFPGSTIGNFTSEQAEALLAGMAELAGPGGGLLIGIDLEKDTAILEAAYNDRSGVTAAFNLNLLGRMQRELGAQLNIEQFEHQALYRSDVGRIEMYLVSRGEQPIVLGDEVIELANGERICTEFSHKYRLPDFNQLLAKVGWQVQYQWVDPRDYFAIVFAQMLE